jgi:hypothetical protein
MDPMTEQKLMTEQELKEAAYEITGGSIKDLSLDQLQRLMTITQFVTDLCLNEIEERGELEFAGDVPVLPYLCDYSVPTILTR